MTWTRWLLAAMLACDASPAIAQDYQSDFPPDEFRARWTGVFERIGDNAVAVVQGMPRTDGFIYPRQYNTFYYLCGIETPGSYLYLDGRTKKVTLYLPPRNAALEAAEGKVLAADDGELVRQLTGVDEVKSLEALVINWPLGGTGPGAGRGGGAPADRRRSMRSSAPLKVPSKVAASCSAPRRRAPTITGTAPSRGSVASRSCCASEIRGPRSRI